MSTVNLKSVFDEVCATLVIDSKLAKRLNDYMLHLINKNADHIAFFGGNLTGVHIVRFTTADRNEWFNDILEADEFELEDKIYAIGSINPEFNVSGDIFNLSCLWLTFAIKRNAKLPTKLKEEMMFNVMMILNIKLLTSLLFNYFKYPTDEAIAKSAYNELSYKFTLKQLGSWRKVIEERSNDIISERSIHKQVFTKFDNDKDIVYSINDIQGRLRDMVKNIYDVIMRVHSQNVRIQSSSAVIELDGVETLKDKTKSLGIYTNYLINIVSTKESLIKEDLMQVIIKQNNNMPERLYRITLDWISDNAVSKDTELINQSLTQLMVHAFDYLNANKVLLRNTTDVLALLTKLKGTYMSSRNNDLLLKEIKDNFENLVKKATNNKNRNMVSATRTGVMLYLVVRAISKNHYTNG